jgi:hypothetical protein
MLGTRAECRIGGLIAGSRECGPVQRGPQSGVTLWNCRSYFARAGAGHANRVCFAVY